VLTERLLAQYRAWCLRNGDHSTRVRSPANWNAELIWKMRMELASAWDLLEDEIPSLTNRLTEAVLEEVHSLEEICQGMF